jgi:hypothetical protein
MRKVYILRDKEEDGSVLDAMEAQGLCTEEEDIENPACPVCGSPTMLAFTEGDEFQVVTWESLEDDDCSEADGWYLVCSSFTCEYEEPIERTLSPMDATLFDLHSSFWHFDEASGINGNPPDDLQELIRYLEDLLKEGPNRKLECFRDEAEWRRDREWERVREWLNIVPAGRKVQFYLEGEPHTATFLMATDDQLLVVTRPQGEMLAISTGSITFYGPHFFDPNKPDPPDEDEAAKFRSGNLILITGWRERAVIGGYHLSLVHVDRFDQYHVSTSDPEAAQALGMKARGENHWEGCFRRSAVEARYDERRMVKVRGHWLQVWGVSNKDRDPAVKSEDPEVAAELGLKPVRSWSENDRPEEERTIVHWSGVIPMDQIEEEKQVRTYHWPIPELEMSDQG